MNSVGDLVLIHYQNRPANYARIEAIKPDIKKDWYQVTLLLLTIPPRTVSWILRSEYINGEPFSMGGQPMKLEGVKGPSAAPVPEEGQQPARAKEEGRPAKVIPFRQNPDDSKGA